MRTYCRYSEDQIRQSGLLSPERMDEVTAAVSARIVPCCTPEGVPVKNAFIADHGEEGRFLHPNTETSHMMEYMRRCCLPAVLTPSELEAINNRCLSTLSEKREREQFEKAHKIEAKDWPHGVWLDDRFFSTIEDLYEYLEEEGCEVPEYVWAAKPKQVIPSLSVADVAEIWVADRGWEDMSVDDLNGTEELQAALDRFTEANADIVSYDVDHGTAIVRNS